MNNVYTLEGLLSGRLLRVPDYQRGYAWESLQRTELLEDLELLGPGREHYTGTVVLHEVDPKNRRMDSEGKSYGVHDVVDGQQRLTTLLILLDAIRRELAALDDESAQALAGGIRRNYISCTAASGLPLHKLELNSDCDHFFRTVTLSDVPGPEGPQISSERRLAEARTEFAAHLAAMRSKQPETFETWLRDFYGRIVNQVKMSLYEVESAAEVGVIFEVMNNRGKPLSELDKVKNYLLYAASNIGSADELAKVVNDAWAEILRQLMAAGLTSSADENQLLRAHWLTAYDPQARSWDGSKSVKARFDLRKFAQTPEALLAALVDYTESLRQASVAFCDIRSPERADSFASISGPARSEIKLWSSKLVRTNVLAPFLPLLIATRLKHADDAARYLGAVKFCELFAFRVQRLAERRADAGQSDLFRDGFRLYTGSASFDTTLASARNLLSWFSSEAAFKAALYDRSDWYDWAGLKYFLFEYEENLAAKKGAVPKVSWEDVRRRERADTVEHILPQVAVHEYWTTRFTPSQRTNLTHDLGNLCLTKDNAAYSNKPFPEKRGSVVQEKPCYATSSFFSERELSSYPDWTPEAIHARRNQLVAWAESRWGADLDEPDGSVLIDTEELDAVME